MTRPDLSALPRDVRVRIAVAETQGARWEYVPQLGGGRKVGWYLRHVRDGEISLEALGHTPVTECAASFRFPRQYLSDPAAWGALLEKERIAVSPNLAGGWQSSWSGSGALFASPNLQPGEVICAAILAKHNVDWTTLEPVG